MHSCDHAFEMNTSNTITAASNWPIVEINVRAVGATIMSGNGFQVLDTICTNMNIPSMNSSNFHKTAKSIYCCYDIS